MCSSTIFIRSGMMWLVALVRNQKDYEKWAFLIDSVHQGNQDSSTKDTHERAVRIASESGKNYGINVLKVKWDGIFWGKFM